MIFEISNWFTSIDKFMNLDKCHSLRGAKSQATWLQKARRKHKMPQKLPLQEP